jgi:hypothetical protein
MHGLEYSNTYSSRDVGWWAVSELHRRHSGLFNRLSYRDLGKYFRYQGDLRPLDLLFEDRCGGASSKVREWWRRLFRPEHLSNGAYVAITLCESPRIFSRNTSIATAQASFDYIVGLCEKTGLGLELLDFKQYDNGPLDAYVSGYSAPMAFMMMRVTH